MNDLELNRLWDEFQRIINPPRIIETYSHQNKWMKLRSDLNEMGFTYFMDTHGDGDLISVYRCRPDCTAADGDPIFYGRYDAVVKWMNQRRMKPFNEMTEEDKFNSDGFEVCSCGMKLPHRWIFLHYSDGNQTICPKCAVAKLDEYITSLG